MADGFESSVAQRMPSTRAHARPSFREVPSPETETPRTALSEAAPLRPAAAAEAAEALRQEAPRSESARPEPPRSEPNARPVRLYEATARPAAPPAAPEGSDVLRIVGQLKGQLLALETTKRALERELSTARRQSEQLAADNLALRRELDAAGAAQAEVARLREENTLIEEESVDILSRLEQLRTENEAQRELLATLSGERQAAMEEIDRLRAAGGESELLSIKAEFLEKERQSLAEENTQIGRECEGLKDEAGALRREAAALRKQLKEIKESLLLVRDSARSDYYNLA